MYVFLFIITFFDLNKIKNFLDKDILGFSISSFVAAAPLGYIMHQIDISINSPFKEKVCGVKRNAIDAIEELRKCTNNLRFKDINKPQMSLEIFKGLLYSDKEKCNFNYFKDEISNRYSYYYSRMEAGIFSPILGFIIFIIIAGVYYSNWGNPFIETNLEIKVRIILTGIFIFIISKKIHEYCKIIIKEIDELECFLVHNYGKSTLNNLEKKN